MGSLNDSDRRPNWVKFDEESERRLQEETAAVMKRSTAHRDFFGATMQARHSAKVNDLFPRRGVDGELVYTDSQARQAACHGREDAAATLQIQLHVLQRLDRNRTLMWIAIGLLIYIALRVS